MYPFEQAFTQHAKTDTTVINAILRRANSLINTNQEEALKLVQKAEMLSLKHSDDYTLANVFGLEAVIYYYNNDTLNTQLYAKKALVYAEKSNNRQVEMRAHNIIGAIEYNKGHFKESENAYLRRIEIGTQLKDSNAVYTTYYNLGLIFAHQSNYLRMADYNFQALHYFEKKKDTVSIILSLESISIAYQNLREQRKALACLFRAKKMAEIHKDIYELEGVYIDISTCYEELKNTDSAFYFLDIALKTASKYDDQYHFTIATLNKANLYVSKKNFDQAIILLKEGERLSRKINRVVGLDICYYNLGQAYFEKKLNDSAFRYAFMGYVEAGKTNNRKFIAFNCLMLSRIFEKKNIPDSALKYLKLHLTANDSLNRTEQLKGIAIQELKFEREHQEQIRAKEKIIAETKLQKQKQINSIIFIASLLLLILLVIGVINYRQKQKANAELLVQKKLLEEKNKEVADSINYASRIQKSIMPDKMQVQEILPNSFVLYLPKDVVSGDFYWINSLKGVTGKTFLVLAVADCTGHGVPGAFMSLIGATILNQTLGMDEINNPAEALDYLNVELPKNIKSSSSSGTIKDGMEISMCAIDYEKMEIMFAGANNNLYIVRNNQLLLHRGDKKPIGESYSMKNQKFSNHLIPMFTGDVIYMTTDGYPDQFGGEKARLNEGVFGQGKKFKYKQMEELFLAIHHLPLNEQSEILEKKFFDWKGNLEQVDDVLVLGMKI
ncbi:MAG: SpoIIE family protein phosphatase [Bacteroidetes bacterium]|nr:SpoIIE family protein phosphatase [Bacteroidota bacterium]